MENITCYSIEPGTGLFRSRNLAQCQRKIKGILAFICSELFMRTSCTLSTCLSINYYKNLYSYLNIISYTILERIVEWTTQKSITDRKDISDSEQRG